LLDEPLSALDLKLRKAMQLELKELQHQVGITFIFVTHDQEEAITMSNRIAVMSDGVVQQIGDPIEIYERPHNRFVADFIGETNFIEGQVAEVSPHQTQVALSGGVKLPARFVAGLTPGQTVTVAVRPEKIALHTAPPSNGTSIPATVNEAVYIGTDTRYTVRLAGEHEVVARLQNIGSALSDGRLFQRGEQVYLSWSLDSAMVLTS
jgi:spermidine/putrescine transport system ATP-binding protein